MPQLTSQRPSTDKRLFNSPAVEALIGRCVDHLGADSQLAWLLENCLPNTLDTTVFFTDGERPDTFVITGDIPAMWLRDSAAQVWPYLPLVAEDPALGRLIAGVINRQTDCIHLDPYANAFLRSTAERGRHDSDETEMHAGVHERKWEVDSLCYAIRLAHGYWRTTGDTAPFDDHWYEAMRLVVRTFREQQGYVSPGPYRFRRTTNTPTDTLGGSGYGAPVSPCGLIASAFRPSDDATVFPYLVPSNCFAVVALEQLADMVTAIRQDERFAGECHALATEVREGIEQIALGPGPHGSGIERCWCYECDGFGNRLFMDDANIPSLLSLPYLGWCPKDDPTYLATRRWVLGDHNPYFRRGREAEAVSGPHVGVDHVWPMAIIMQALTSTDAAEQRACVDTLRRTHADTGFMHETFHADNSDTFSRPWFAWANTLFGELIVTLIDEGVLSPSG